MQPKLLQTEKALYLIEEWDGVNRSGMIPKSNLILVRADEAADRSAGGVFYDDEVRERHTLASETGIIIAMGSQAFKTTLDGRRWPDDDPDKPKVGDRVWFQRYSGSMHLGFDKRAYRLMNDSCIGATFDQATAPFIDMPAPAMTPFVFPTTSAEAERATAAAAIDVDAGAPVNAE